MLRITLVAALIFGSFASAQTDRKCAFTSFGDSCGPKLAGKFVTSDKVGLIAVVELTSAPKRVASVMAIGTKKITVTLPNKCRIFVSPVLLLTFRTSNKGGARWALPVPASLKGTVLFQSGHDSDKGIRTSNGLDATCK